LHQLIALHVVTSDYSFGIRPHPQTSMNRATWYPSPLDDEPPRLLARLPMVVRVTGLGRSTIYRLVADGSFPPPVHLGPRAVGWRWSDLDQWSRSRTSGPH
jgi:prophage regulatory protein